MSAVPHVSLGLRSGSNLAVLPLSSSARAVLCEGVRHEVSTSKSIGESSRHGVGFPLQSRAGLKQAAVLCRGLAGWPRPVCQL